MNLGIGDFFKTALRYFYVIIAVILAAVVCAYAYTSISGKKYQATVEFLITTGTAVNFCEIIVGDEAINNAIELLYASPAEEETEEETGDAATAATAADVSDTPDASDAESETENATETETKANRLSIVDVRNMVSAEQVGTSAVAKMTLTNENKALVEKLTPLLASAAMKSANDRKMVVELHVAPPENADVIYPVAKNLLIGAAVGLVLAAAAIYILTLTDKRLYSRKDVNRYFPDTEVISALPKGGKADRGALKIATANLTKFISEGKNCIAFAGVGKETEETVAFDTAAAFAEAGKKVAYLDMRDGALVNNGADMYCEAMNGLKEAELFEEIRRFKESYYAVIINLPSVGTSSDADVLHSVADGYVLKVRAKHDNAYDVHNAICRIEQTGASVLGFVAYNVGNKDVYGGYGVAAKRKAEEDINQDIDI